MDSFLSPFILFYAILINMKRIENKDYIIEINEKGAELSRVYSKKYDLEYLWLGDEKYWMGHSPILFPFIGRMLDQKYTYKGKTYDMTKHGIARYFVYDVKEIENGLVFSKVNDNPNYPFEFVFSVRYTLEGDTLRIDHEVENTGNEVMLYGFGGHPAFNVPLNRNLSFEDYYLEFPDAGANTQQRLFSEDFLDADKTKDFPLADKRLYLRHSLFDNDAVVIKNGGYKVVIKSDKDVHSVTVEYPGIDNCGFWHAMQTDAPYVCVEPWMCMPGPAGRILALEEMKDFVHLDPGKKNVHTIIIELA